MTPFRLVCSLVLGSPVQTKTMANTLVILIGGGMHFIIAIIFGMLFAAVLSLLWQISARRWVLIAYGAMFGFFLYEVSFLAVLPVSYPRLERWFDLKNQLTKGIAAYALVYGPTLAIYLSITRPGVRAPWILPQIKEKPTASSSHD